MMTSFLDVGREVAINMGIDAINTIEDDSHESVIISQFVNETADELLRRVDWQSLRKTYTAATSQSTIEYPVPADFDRLTIGGGVIVDGLVLRGSLSSSEWFTLPSVIGIPRYFYMDSSVLLFYPSPTDNLGIVVSYQSTQYVERQDGSNADKLASNTDKTFLPRELLVRGAVWRWNRHSGRDYNDQLSEYEAMLQDYANAEGGYRLP